MKKSYTFNGDCLDGLRRLKNNSVDSLVTDPPAGISFMGKAWDDDKGGRKQWIAWMTEIMSECHRVLKPGAHGLIWALPRTSHWTATALEDAGFEVRDVVTHLFGSGFPKSLDVSKAIDKAAGAEREVVGANPNHRGASQMRNPYTKSLGQNGVLTSAATAAAKKWQGWGTALKPASEHWILVRKPCSEKTVAANVLKWGTGALNIDASRIEGKLDGDPNRFKKTDGGWAVAKFDNAPVVRSEGRFPANLTLDEYAAQMLDEQSGTLKTNPGKIKATLPDNTGYGGYARIAQEIKPDSGGASRFFYCAKISKSERNAGLDTPSTHPTVKPKRLMTYLIRMITPPGGVVLDPFMGSGSTGVAAVEAKFKFLGIEKEKEYFVIANKRINQ